MSRDNVNVIQVKVLLMFRLKLSVMILLSVHMMTSHDRICVQSVINGFTQKWLWIVTSWSTGKVILARSSLNVLFVADVLLDQRILLYTAGFTVEWNHTNVTYVTRRSVSLDISENTWESTRETNHSRVQHATNDSAPRVSCRATVTRKHHMTVSTARSHLRRGMIWSVMPVSTLVQSRTHVDTVQTALCGRTNLRDICWSHTMKVLGSLVTSVRRNSASLVTWRNIYVVIKLQSRMFAVNVRSVSIRQPSWSSIWPCTWMWRSSDVICVVKISRANDTWWVTWRDVSIKCNLTALQPVKTERFCTQINQSIS